MAVPKPLIQRDGFWLKVTGFEHEAIAAAGLSLCFQQPQKRAGDTSAAVTGKREHALEFTVPWLEHDGPTSDRMARLIASDHEDDIRLRQGGDVDSVVAVRRIERLLVFVELLDEREDFGLVCGLYGDAHEVV